jgi:hypothetical protein
MRAAILPGAALLVLGPAISAGAEQPLLRPNRDVTVVYRSPGPGGLAVEQRVRWSAASQTMRIDPPDRDLHVIVDYAARRMSVINDATRSVVQMAAPDDAAAIGGAQTAGAYARVGQGAVAGRACAEWQGLDHQGHVALVCITEDGVLLRAGTPDTVRVTAISVEYAPQDAAAFRVPADYTRLAPGASR